MTVCSWWGKQPIQLYSAGLAMLAVSRAVVFLTKHLVSMAAFSKIRYGGFFWAFFAKFSQ